MFMINELPNIKENQSEYSIYLTPDPEGDINFAKKVIVAQQSLKMDEMGNYGQEINEDIEYVGGWAIF